MSGSSVRVWLIDDSEADLYLLRRAVLGAYPRAQVTTFGDAASAIDRWRLDPPDCVFVDFNLGTETALGLVDLIDETPDHAPAVSVLLSGVAPPKCFSERMRRSPVAWQLREKPLRAEHVTAALEQAGFTEG